MTDWYAAHKRSLPWRNRPTPYRVWVSEVMLQQTRVDTVAPYYRRFMKRFPSLKALASANVNEVLKAWEGLGYYSRARNLHRAAGIVRGRYAGRFPREFQDIAALPGIGPYTTGAILSIAFNQPFPAVDGNVLRVMSRLSGSRKDIKSPAIRDGFAGRIQAMIPEGRASDFTQAMMELGALVCTPVNPGCRACPLAKECIAQSQGLQHRIPFASPGVPPRLERRMIAVIHKGDKVLLNRRPEKALLGGMWEYPNVIAKTSGEFKRGMSREYDLNVAPGESLGNATHVFSHIRWEMTAVSCRMGKTTAIPNTGKWMSARQLDRIAMPVAFQRIRRLVEQRGGRDS